VRKKFTFLRAFEKNKVVLTTSIQFSKWDTLGKGELSEPIPPSPQNNKNRDVRKWLFLFCRTVKEGTKCEAH